MRLITIHGVEDLRLDQVAPPVCGPRDAIIRVRACGICGTDISHLRTGGKWNPMPLGHEAAGTVIEVGPEVKDVTIGQRVLVNPTGTGNSKNVIGCGGTEGAFTENLLVREAKLGATLLPVPDGLPLDIAALAEPLAVALHGINRSEARPGEKVAIFGCGPIGLGMILWLRRRGVTDIAAIDLSSDRLAMAREFGAAHCIQAGVDDLSEALKAAHGTAPSYRGTGAGTDLFIDVAGAPTILSDIIAVARRHSRLVITASYKTPVTVDLGSLLGLEMNITTAVAYPTELADALAALPDIQDQASRLITHRFAFDDALEAFAVARQPIASKVMIEFEGATA